MQFNTKVEGHYRFFSNRGGHAGVSFDDAGGLYTCSLFGLQTFVFPMEMWVKVYDKAILAPTEEGPFVIVKAGDLRRVGLDIGSWQFGFLGDVTPADGDRLIFLETGLSNRTNQIVVIWIHDYVE